MAKEDLTESKKRNLKKLISLGVEPYPYFFNKTHDSTDVHKECKKLKNGEKLKKSVSVSGRLMSKREFGKLFFFDLIDEKGKVQIVLSKGSLEKKVFEQIPLIDVGDIVGVKGNIYKSNRGEPSVFATCLELLCKSINPLPEKWHGLKDIEVRHRKRYLDLIMNPETKDVFLKRSKIITLIRKFLDEHDFLEVETPLLQPLYGGATARPFKTLSNAWKSTFYLSISPELYLKRLLVGGFERVYTISKNFRNEDVDKTHNPEFTMMECYASYWDYNVMMEFVEDLFISVAKNLFNDTKIDYQGTKINLKKPWTRITVYEALKKYAGIDAKKISDEELKELLEQNDLELETFKRGLAIAELFEHYCESKLIQPTFVIDHPKETTPLCKGKRGAPELIERFEPFINGWEMGNAYSELNDPQLQRKIFQEQAEQGRAKGESHPIDEDFIESLEYGMPPASGFGLGIDRMVMLFTNRQTIRDVILFPQMKPKK